MTAQIHHVAIAIQRENLVAAVQQFTELLGLEFEGPLVFGDVELYVDWEAGIELAAPAHRDDTSSELARQLQNSGEGLWRVVVGVPKLADAVARAESLGFGDALDRIDALASAPDSWKTRFARTRARLPDAADLWCRSDHAADG